MSFSLYSPEYSTYFSSSSPINWPASRRASIGKDSIICNDGRNGSAAWFGAYPLVSPQSRMMATRVISLTRDSICRKFYRVILWVCMLVITIFPLPLLGLPSCHGAPLPSTNGKLFLYHCWLGLTILHIAGTRRRPVGHIQLG